MTDVGQSQVRANTLTISYPQPAALLNLNDREHWAPRALKIKAWREATRWAAIGYTRHPLWLAYTPCYVLLSLPVPDRRHRDPHNYTPTLKAVVDGLADSGLWPNDRPQWVTTIEPQLIHDPEGRHIVTLTIWPLDEVTP